METLIIQKNIQKVGNYSKRDNNLKRGCTAWARMWYWYHKYHNREVYEIAMFDLNKKRGYMVTVAKINDKYQLFDYRPINKKADNIKKALNNNLVNYNNFIWNINKK